MPPQRDRNVYIRPPTQLPHFGFTSLHPDHCKQGIPYSQLLRLRRISSDNDDFAARAAEMKAFFQARGYPEALLNDDLCKISTVSRNEELRPSAERDSTEGRVPLVLTYNQFNTGTKRILLDNFEMLLSDPARCRIGVTET